MLHAMNYWVENFVENETTKPVSILFKAGRYCSFANYIGRAMAEHIATFHIHGCHWSEEIEPCKLIDYSAKLNFAFA